MKDLNRMTAQELDSELSRLVHLRTATYRITPIFEPQSIGFVSDIDGNEPARCTHESIRDYIVTFNPATVHAGTDAPLQGCVVVRPGLCPGNRHGLEDRRRSAGHV